MARQRGVRHESQALACEVLDNRKNAEAAPVSERQAFAASPIRAQPKQKSSRLRPAA